MKRFPDALVLLFLMIVIAQVMTYVIPTGAYDFAPVAEEIEAPLEVTVPAGEVVPGLEGQELTLPVGATIERPGREVIPGSYHRTSAERLPWHAALTLVPKGLEAAADVIFFVLIVGGVIEVIKKTGAIDALIGSAINTLGSRPVLLVAGMTALFAVGSSTIGMAEEYMPFIPILVAMCLAMGMDAVVAMGIVYVGAGVGYGCAAMNPFTVAIAKQIADQPLLVGAGLRWGLLVVMLAIGVHHVMRYAKRVRDDPTKSLVAGIDYSEGYSMPDDVRLTSARVAVLVAFVAMLLVFVYGAKQYGWFMVELAALFLALALLAMAVARISPNQGARAFIEGAAGLSGTAILIGFARTIGVVLEEAEVIHTIIHACASALQSVEGLGSGVASVVGAWGMLVVQSVCNFLIPSGSGQAYVTMPIMSPLAEVTGLGAETAVFAYQFGDGLTNMLVPTNALLMGMLLLAKIPYQQWVRFIVPLLFKLYLVCLVVLAWLAIVSPYS